MFKIERERCQFLMVFSVFQSWFHSYQQGVFASHCCSSFHTGNVCMKTNTEIKLKYVLKEIHSLVKLEIKP